MTTTDEHTKPKRNRQPHNFQRHENWCASRFPDSRPNKVWPGMEVDQCRNGVGSFLPSFGTKRSRW